MRAAVARQTPMPHRRQSERALSNNWFFGSTCCADFLRAIAKCSSKIRLFDTAVRMNESFRAIGL